MPFPPGRGPDLSPPTTGTATAGLICGIAAFCIAFLPFAGLLAVVPGVVAIVFWVTFGIDRRPGRRRAIAGGVLGFLGVMLGPVMSMVIPALLVGLPSTP